MCENENKIIHEQETEEQETKEQLFVKLPSHKKQAKGICLILFGMLVCLQYNFHMDYYDFEWWISTSCGVLGLSIALSGEIRKCWDAVKRFFVDKLT